jgi:hypothetical protein
MNHRCRVRPPAALLAGGTGHPVGKIHWCGARPSTTPLAGRGRGPVRFDPVFSAEVEICLLCVFSKFFKGVVVLRTWSGIPSTGSLGLLLHRPIKFRSPLKNEKAPHDLRAILVYVEVVVDPFRLSPYTSLAPSTLGLF